MSKSKTADVLKIPNVRGVSVRMVQEDCTVVGVLEIGPHPDSGAESLLVKGSIFDEDSQSHELVKRGPMSQDDGVLSLGSALASVLKDDVIGMHCITSTIPAGYEGYCTDCGVMVESFGSKDGCDNCGSKSPPCGDRNQVGISINWHELRCLAMWAERWAEENFPDQKGVVYSIAQRIADQCPGMAPLTFAGELNHFRDKGFSVEGLDDFK